MPVTGQDITRLALPIFGIRSLSKSALLSLKIFRDGERILLMHPRARSETYQTPVSILKYRSLRHFPGRC